MIFKSYITKAFLAIIPLVLVSGYFERYLYLLPQYFSKTNIYAADTQLNFKGNLKLPKFENIPLTLIEKIKSTKIDTNRYKSVQTYLQRRNSPLASKAGFIVQCAKYYGIDYRLVAAISIVESSGGIHTYRPYNAWGWGGANSAFTFRNWEEAIITVSKGLAGYYDRGADTPIEIAPTYNPHTPKDWSQKVTYIMSLM